MPGGRAAEADARAWMAENPDFMHRRPPLLNIGELATVLGAPYYFARGMKLWGFPMPGGRATEADARAWLKKHPHFRPSLPPPQEHEAGSAGADSADRQLAIAGKLGGS